MQVRILSLVLIKRCYVILLIMKQCSKCKLIKSQNEFQKDTRYRSGYRGTCKSCHTKYMQDYYSKNEIQRQRKNKINSKTRPPWKRHKLTQGLYEEMLDKYDGLCYACKVDKAVAIDHDKQCCPGATSCGKCVRGLLCNYCNSALGFIKDDPSRAYGIIEYLHSQVTQLVE